MNHFLTQLPIIITNLSKALLKAIIAQILEVVRACQKVIRSLWLVYRNIESSILETIVDIGFSILALRYFLGLIAVGVIFLYLNWWWAFIIYVIVIVIAVIRFFKMPTGSSGRETDAHLQNKATIVNVLRWPLRILFSLIIIYLSWYSNIFGKMDFSSQFEKTQKSINSESNNSLPTSNSNNFPVGHEPANSSQYENIQKNINNESNKNLPTSSSNSPVRHEPTNKIEEQVTQTEIARPPVEPVSVLSPPSFSPSFDCAKVSTESERLICSNAELAALDVEMSHIYKRVLNSTTDKVALKREQNKWRKSFRDACTDTGCIANSYSVRINQLNEQ